MKKSIRFAFLAVVMAILMGITMLGVGCGEEPPAPPPDDNPPVEEVNPNLHLMTFELNEDGNSYTFKAIAREAEGDIKIPAKYEGKPVTKIGKDACIGNEAITSVIIPDGVTVIGENAFKNCISVTSVTLPNTLVYIEAYAFMKCPLPSVTFPKTLKKIGDHAYDNTGLESITFNEGLEEIGDRVFDYSKAKSLYLPDSLTKIGWRAFIYMKQLETLSIGNKVKSIGDQAFADSFMMKEIEFRGTKAQFDAIVIDNSRTNYGWDNRAGRDAGTEDKHYVLKCTDSKWRRYSCKPLADCYEEQITE